MATPIENMTERLEHARRTLIVGLGRTGLSVARYLCRQGAPVAIVDSRQVPPALEELRARLPVDVALFLGGFHAEAFERAEQIVLSPGVAPDTAAVAAARARGVPVIGDIELFARVAAAPVVAITGSNGKSTVTTLLGAMAQHAGLVARTGGNIGTPALELIEEQEPDLYILELSSFQLETTVSLRPAAAVVLNISADHMDRYPDLAAYSEAKRGIYRHAAVQIVNADDPVAAALADPQHRQVRFTRRVPAPGEYGICAEQDIPWIACGEQPILAVSEIALRGTHNVMNALAALALGEAVGLPRRAMVAALREFRGLPHRMQLILRRRGVRWYNDSKGTNVGATLAAIEGLPGRVVLIAGGDAKGSDLAPLAAALHNKGRAALLLGKDAPRLQEILATVLPVERVADMAQAVQRAAELAQPGDSVLLSPACASTDMYRDYQERGEIFSAAVRGLTP
jgi:UDP-N-acetylmuramoylalanine--D-glutamate ligase